MKKTISILFFTGMLAAIVLTLCGCGNSLEKDYAIVREIQKEGNSTRMEELTPEKIATFDANDPPGKRHIVDLTLSGQGLTSLSHKIGKLIYLRQLDLERNNIETLPSELCNLRNLSHIKLDYNNLSSLPDSFSILNSLEELWIGNNKLRIIPPQIYSLKNLKILILDKNEISFIDNKITSLAKLGSFNIDGNLICKQDSILVNWLAEHAGSNWQSTQNCN